MNIELIINQLEEMREDDDLILRIKKEINEIISKGEMSHDEILLFIKINKKEDVINNLKDNNYKNLIKLNDKYPQEAYNLIIDLDLREDILLLNDDKSYEIKFLKEIISENGKTENAYKLIKKVKFKVEYYITFCDRFGVPANCIELIRDCAKNKIELSEDNLIRILKINKARNNIKFIEEFLSYKSIFKNKNNLIKLLPEINSQLIDCDYEEIISKIIKDNFDENDLIFKEAIYYNFLKKEKIEPIKIYEIFKNDGELIENFINRILTDKNPRIFEKLIMSFETNANIEAAHKFCIDRLKIIPNSQIVIEPLIRMFGKHNQLALALNLHKKAYSRFYRAGATLQEAKLASKIGEWGKYQLEFNKYYKYLNIIGGNRPAFAMAEMFFIDAAPNIEFEKKINLYKLISESKYIRKKINKNKNEKLKIGLFSGDLRIHAMYPFIDLLIEAIKQTDTEIHIFNSAPKNTNDSKTTEIFSNNKNYYNINAFNTGDLYKIRDIKLDVAIDLSQHTTFNTLNYFKVGIAPKQITASWASGFSTGMKEFDDIILDDFSFKFITSKDIVENPIRIRNSQIVNATQSKLKNIKIIKNDITIGIFCRPNRLNENIFLMASKIAKLYGYKFIYDHYQVAQEDVKKFLYQKFFNYGMPKENIIIKSNPLLEVIDEVDVAMDSFPANSPTTTRDLILNGIPVIVLNGKDPYSRFSGSFLDGLDLSYLMANNEEEFLLKFENIKALISKFHNHDFINNFKSSKAIAIEDLKNYINSLK
jgi:predicted O-linked N-acetylglucosamine transferase (SPINDLY family)